VNEKDESEKSRFIATRDLTISLRLYNLNAAQLNSVPYIVPTADSPSPTISTEKHNITLYCEGTPDPLKISIALEEFGLKYNIRTHHRFSPRNRNP
jgi:hypothetical protein